MLALSRPGGKTMKIPRPSSLVWGIIAVIWLVNAVLRFIANEPVTHFGVALLIALGCLIMADLQRLIKHQENKDGKT